MAGWTNRGKYACLGLWFRAVNPFTAVFYMILLKATPTQDTNLVSDTTQIALGNGYSDGGSSLARAVGGFDVWTEDDTNDWALVQAVDVVWSASGGPIPSDSAGATYAALTNDNATVANREIYHYGSLGGARVVSSGQSLTIQNFETRITES